MKRNWEGVLGDKGWFTGVQWHLFFFSPTDPITDKNEQVITPFLFSVHSQERRKMCEDGPVSAFYAPRPPLRDRWACVFGSIWAREDGWFAGSLGPWV